MPSGMKLTAEQIDVILRLVGELDGDGQWRMTYTAIADRLGIRRQTIYRVVRKAAAGWGRHTAWKSDKFT